MILPLMKLILALPPPPTHIHLLLNQRMLIILLPRPTIHPPPSDNGEPRHRVLREGDVIEGQALLAEAVAAAAAAAANDAVELHSVAVLARVSALVRQRGQEPVHAGGERCAQRRPDEVDPDLGHVRAIDDGGAERPCWVDGGAGDVDTCGLGAVVLAR